MITITVREIIDLAGAAGLTLNQRFLPTGDDLDVEWVVMECPDQGVLNDDNQVEHYQHIAYLHDYPEEGSFSLGEQV